MILTQQPIPKTIEDLAQEVSDDTLLAKLESQRALQEAAIRSYKLDTPVVGVVQATQPQSEDSTEDSGGDSADEDDYGDDEVEEEYEEDE